MSLFKMASLISFRCGGSCNSFIADEYFHCISGHKRCAGYMATYGSLPSYSLWTVSPKDTSLLHTVCFVPGERKPLHFLKI